jgi:hypothetical protein
MKSTSLLQHISLAIALSCLAFVNDVILKQWVTAALSVRLNLSLSVFLYLGYLMRCHPMPAGRMTLLMINLVVLLVCLSTDARFSTLLWVYLVMIWINRSLLRYASVVAAAADLGLSLFSAGAFYAIFSNGYGLVTSLWCFLLLQALHSVIPGKKVPIKPNCKAPADQFDRALHSAENALQQLLK